MGGIPPHKSLVTAGKNLEFLLEEEEKRNPMFLAQQSRDLM